MLEETFFNRNPEGVAKDLLGKVLYSKIGDVWLSAMIIETESYYLSDKASHASLGFTEKRAALFMKAGTIYMYYSRGGDSLNVSCRGKGNAVLIKAAKVITRDGKAIQLMAKMHPKKKSLERLCSGQALLCRSLGLKVRDWDKKEFDPRRFFIKNEGMAPQRIIQCKRLGIPPGRDEDLPYRFVHYDYADFCSKNPLKSKNQIYKILERNKIGSFK
jgi:DNA-3-methyladenine glycosylase